MSGRSTERISRSTEARSAPWWATTAPASRAWSRSCRAPTGPTRVRSGSTARPVAFGSPAAAQALGIATVYQDLALAADLTPFENLFLGREEMRPGLLRPARVRRPGRHAAPRHRAIRPPRGAASLGRRARLLPVGRPAPIGRHRARRPVGRPGDLHGRAHRGARRGPDRPRDRPHPSGPRPGDRGRAHQPQHAPGARRGGQDSRSCASAGGWRASRPGMPASSASSPR